MAWFDNTNVNLLGCDDFDNDKPWLLKDKRCSFVLVFAQFCGYCLNTKPEYIKFADKAQFMHVYALDAGENENLIKRINEHSKSPFKIKGYPTILIYSNGKFKEEYEGDRDWQSFLQKAMKVCTTKCKCNKK